MTNFQIANAKKGKAVAVKNANSCTIREENGETLLNQYAWLGLALRNRKSTRKKNWAKILLSYGHFLQYVFVTSSSLTILTSVFVLLSQAGLAHPSNPEQILIALEPEAASVYCREQKLREFVAESGSNDDSVEDTIARPESQYMVIDIGGKFNFSSSKFSTRNS